MRAALDAVLRDALSGTQFNAEAFGMSHRLPVGWIVVFLQKGDDPFRIWPLDVGIIKDTAPWYSQGVAGGRGGS